MACTASACLLYTALIASLHSGTINDYQERHFTVFRIYMKHNCAGQIFGCVPHNASAFLQSLLHAQLLCARRPCNLSLWNAARQLDQVTGRITLPSAQ